MPPLTDKAASFARTETEEGTVGDVPEMVEAMAIAMYDAFMAACAHNFGPNYTPTPWGEADDQVRRYYRASARAGIERLREPTEEMLEASCAAHVEQWNGVKKVGYRPGPGDVAKPCFVAAIDAALGNPPVAR